jgi:hypothetical protein
MPTQPNPDTHCTSCGEVLSLYHHCWSCDYPPMDPAQDAITQTTMVYPAQPTHTTTCPISSPCTWPSPTI